MTEPEMLKYINDFKSIKQLEADAKVKFAKELIEDLKSDKWNYKVIEIICQKVNRISNEKLRAIDFYKN